LLESNLPLINTDDTDQEKTKPFCRRFALMNADQEKQTYRGGAENSDSFDGLNGHSINFTRLQSAEIGMLEPRSKVNRAAQVLAGNGKHRRKCSLEIGKHKEIEISES